MRIVPSHAILLVFWLFFICVMELNTLWPVSRFISLKKCATHNIIRLIDGTEII